MPLDKPKLDGVKVLLVDPKADAAVTLKEFLESYGTEVQLAASVNEALGLLKNRKPHVIISDLSFPERDGFSFIRSLRSMNSEDGGQIPAIAFGTVAVSERALTAGFQAFVLESCPPDPMVGLIQRLVNLPERPHLSYDAERPARILTTMDRGITNEYQFYTYLVQDAEIYPLCEIWAAIPERAKDGFKKWILDNAVNDDFEIMTNNYTVKSIVQVRAFKDFIEGRSDGKAPAKGALWNIRGTR